MPVTHDVIIFDGSCGFCRSCVAWLRRRLKSGARLAMVASQEFDDNELAAMGLGRADVREFVWWVGSSSKERGWRAVACALRQACGPWPLLGRLLLCPPVSKVAPLAYRAVARNRHRLPGATAGCKVGDADREPRR